MGEKNWPVSRLLRHSPSPGDTSAFFSPSSVPRTVNPGGAVTTNRKDLKLSFTEGRNPFRFRGERNSGLAISSSDVLSGPGGHQG